GSVGVLSFGRGKGLTGGSGGALLAHDAAGARIVERAGGLLAEPHAGWRDLVALAAQLFLARASVYAVPAALPFLRLGQTVYRKPRALRAPTAVSCSVVAATWPLADRETEARRGNAARLLAALEGHGELETIRALRRARPGYLRLPVLATTTARRAAGEARARRLGIM